MFTFLMKGRRESQRVILIFLHLIACGSGENRVQKIIG